VLDVAMPDLDGWETLAALRRIRPGLPAVIASGYGDARAVPDAGDGPTVFVSKPYEPETLVDALREVLTAA
jgi:CheY-like chemotaxis protein